MTSWYRRLKAAVETTASSPEGAAFSAICGLVTPHIPPEQALRVSGRNRVRRHRLTLEERIESGRRFLVRTALGGKYLRRSVRFDREARRVYYTPRARCGGATLLGGPCQNYADSCRFHLPPPMASVAS